MDQNLKITATSPLLLAPNSHAVAAPNDHKATKETVVSAEPAAPKKAPTKVKNIHSQIFKEFRRVLYTPPVYNKEEINMLLTDQQNMVEDTNTTE